MFGDLMPLGKGPCHDLPAWMVQCYSPLLWNHLCSNAIFYCRVSLRTLWRFLFLVALMPLLWELMGNTQYLYLKLEQMFLLLLWLLVVPQGQEGAQKELANVGEVVTLRSSTRLGNTLLDVRESAEILTVVVTIYCVL